MPPSKASRAPIIDTPDVRESMWFLTCARCVPLSFPRSRGWIQPSSCLLLLSELKGGVRVGEGWEINPSGGRAGDTGFRGKAERGSRFGLLQKETREAERVDGPGGLGG